MKFREGDPRLVKKLTAFRIPVEMDKILRSLANENRTSFSEYIRSILISHLKEQGVWPPKNDL